MNLQTPDYKGPDRRNGGKLRLSNGDLFKVVSTGVVLLVSGVVAWTNIRADVNILKKDVEEVAETPLKIGVIEEKVGNLEENVEDLKSEFRNFTIEQRTMNQRILDAVLRVE